MFDKFGCWVFAYQKERYEEASKSTLDDFEVLEKKIKLT